MIRTFGVFGVQSHMQRDCTSARAVACLHPHISISNVIVSLVIHDNMYIYIYKLHLCIWTKICVFVYLCVYYIYMCVCVYECMYVDTHLSTRRW